MVINSTIQSSKTSGPIAAAWAMLRFLGEEGFRDIVRRSQEATRLIIKGIEKIEGIDVIGKPDMCMFTIASDHYNVFEIDDMMRERDWHMIPQFACGGSPPNLHVSLSQANTPHVEKFLEDLTDVIKILKNEGSSINMAELKGIATEVENKPVEEVMMAIIPVIGLTSMELPEKMATLNTVLNLLSGQLRDELLTIFFNM